MKKTISITTFFTFICFAFACSKKNSIASVQTQIQNLYNYTIAANLNEIGTAKKLEGKWVWTNTYCADMDKNNIADKVVNVTFLNNGTFNIIENNIDLGIFNYTLNASATKPFFYFSSTPYNNYLNGKVLFTDSQLDFTTSEVDGCDFMFSKVN